MSRKKNKVKAKRQKPEGGRGSFYLLSFILYLLSFGVSLLLADEQAPSDSLARTEEDSLAPGIALSGVCDGRAVRLTWTTEANFDPAWYVVYRELSAHLPTDSTRALGVFSEPFYVDEAVAPGHVYYYHISAVDMLMREEDRSDEVAVWVAEEEEVALEPTECVMDGLPTEYDFQFTFHGSPITEVDLREVSASFFGSDASPFLASAAVDAGTGRIALYFGMDYSASDSIFAERYLAPNGAGASWRISMQAVHGEASVIIASKDGENWRELSEAYSPLTPSEVLRIKTHADAERIGVELLIPLAELWVTDRVVDPSVRYHLRKSDTEAPMPPTALSVTPEIGQNRLTWIASPDFDVVRICIYRSTEEVPASPLTTYHAPLTEMFIDTTAAAEIAYVYQISAVDRFGNESVWSEPAEGTALPSDMLGPMVSELRVTPDMVVAGEGVYMWAALSDIGRGGSPITAVEALFDSSGEFGTGMSFEAKDGWFDEPEEEIEGTLFFPTREHGEPYRLYVHGMDALWNWGPFAMFSVFVATPRDTLPPPKVEDVQVMDVAGDERGALFVMWSASPAPDAMGYRVYRADTSGDGAMSVLGETGETSFFDTTSTLEGAYLYGVTAVDSCGNEGVLGDVTGPVHPLDDVAPRMVKGSFRPAPGAVWVSTDAPIVFKVGDEGIGLDATRLLVVVNGAEYTAEHPEVAIFGSDSLLAVTVRPEGGFDLGAEVLVTVSAQDWSGNRFEEETLFSIEPWRFHPLASDSVVAFEADSLAAEGASGDSVSLRGVPEQDGWIHLGTVEGAPQLPEGVVGWGEVWAIAGDSVIFGDEEQTWTLRIFLPAEEEEIIPEHLWLFTLDEEYTWRRATLFDGGLHVFQSEIRNPKSEIPMAFGAYSEEEPPYLVEAEPARDETEVSLEAPIRLRIRDDGAGVDRSSVRLAINGEELDASEVVISEDDSADVLVGYEPPVPWALGEPVHVAVSAADLAGAANALSEEFFFSVLGDTTAPRIAGIKMGPFESGMEGEIAVEVRDEGPGDSLSVWLFYGMGGAASYDSLELIEEEGWHRGVVPGAAIGMRGLKIRIHASDGRNETNFPDEGWMHEEVRISGEMFPLEFPPGAVRMFSLPFVSEADRVLGFLEDALGPYDSERWQVLRRNERGGYDEYPDLMSTRPGQAFYLMVSESMEGIVSGEGRSTRSDRSYEVLLHPGWNQVGVPFAFPVSWASIMEASGYPDVEGPWVFDGTNRLIGFAQNDDYGAMVLEPWKGYWIRNRGASPVILSVPPEESGQAEEEREGDTPSPPLSLGQWMMRMSVWADEGIGESERLGDPDNFIGISGEALEGWDRSDLSEPPMVGPTLVLYFPHHDWEENSTDLAGDFRPYEGETLTWNFVVAATDTTVRAATLTFEGAKDVPEGLRVVLLDPERTERVDLSEVDSYSFAFNGDAHRRSMTLVIEGDLFEPEAKSSRVTAAAEPVWLQNFPNPFNNRTSITYTVSKEALPEGAVEARCTLMVYNMLGQEMCRLVDAPKAPGTYSLEWDGREVGAGIYFLKLRVGTLDVMKRIILVK